MGQLFGVLTEFASVNVIGWILAVLLCGILVKPVFSPLREIPGPILARYTRAWYLLKVYKGDFEKTNVELHKKYGPIVRIAPNQYVFGDPDSLKPIYGHGTAFTKADWYQASSNAEAKGHDLFTDQDNKRHGENRRKVATLYSMTSLLQYEWCAEECSEVFITRLNELALSNKAIDLQHWLQCYAFDVIGMITLSKRFGFLDAGEDKGGLLAALHTYLVYLTSVGIVAELHPYLTRLLSKFKSTAGMSYLMEFTGQQIDLARTRSADELEKNSASGCTDFTTKLLDLHEKSPEKVSMKTVVASCLSNIAAGSDTTSISLSAILYYLIQNPKKLSSARAELKEASSRGMLSTPVTFQQAQSLPYLQACIKEALRLHPATGLPLARVVPKGGAVISGTFFPEGTVVGVNAWVMNYSEAVYGSDAAEYRPERWLEDTKANSNMDRCLMTFGLGSRTCIGKNISLMEISKVLPELISRFDFELESEQPLVTLNVWFVKQRNFFCRVKLRHDQSQSILE